MGVPALFRWLSKKYPKIISSVIEERNVIDGVEYPVDTTQPNPNGEEVDNLYLDFNAIVHPCSHPDNKPPPATESEMMMEIFKYTDRVVNMVRPRRLLYIAVDGVAPRAKMNQQRSRRFRAAKDAKDADEKKAEFQILLRQQRSKESNNEESTTDEVIKKTWDSNVITPGTPFMFILAQSVRYWCQWKLNTDPAWAELKVIISDATVPGEGEHKIMQFIRSQRSDPEYDPNTHHVMYGLDADLIMLGLATHEPHFRILREDVFFQESKARTCNLCGQPGHYADQCRGTAKEKSGDFDEKAAKPDSKPYIWLSVSILREYLSAEMFVPGQSFRFDLERAIDDWVFMCFFVGNDFLPHLPSLDVHEDGIDKLIAIWRDNIPIMGGYLTSDASSLDVKVDYNMVVNRGAVDKALASNKSAAAVLKEQMLAKKNAVTPTKSGVNGISETVEQTPESALGKRKADIIDAESDSATPGRSTPVEAPKPNKFALDNPPPDTVRLWEEGYASRYYQQKFHVSPDDIEFRHKVARSYVEGVCWVLLYYFQGCPSWTWYYPYHYAPFAADFVDLDKMTAKFDKGKPFHPYEQLMGVLPAASNHAIPKVFHPLMTDEDSDIIDFYPEDFELDMNGKKQEWKAVVLLPFIDEKRLIAAMATKYPLLTDDERKRNEFGKEALLMSDRHALYDTIALEFYSKKAKAATKSIRLPTHKGRLAGSVTKNEDFLPHMHLVGPEDDIKLEPDVEDDRSMSVFFAAPPPTHVHKSMLFPGVKLPEPVLDQTDLQILKSKARTSGRDFGGAPLYDNSRQDRMDRRPEGRINYRADAPPGLVPPPIPIPGVSGGDNRYAPFLDPRFAQGMLHGLPPPPIPPPPPGWYPTNQVQSAPPPGNGHGGRNG
ncbi:hypothetical protein DV737_g4425, partial [Chaetothyriales sp. CBS 132003]